jgi:hypothetical protein
MINEDSGIAGECIQNKGRYKKTVGGKEEKRNEHENLHVKN